MTNSNLRVFLIFANGFLIRSAIQWLIEDHKKWELIVDSALLTILLITLFYYATIFIVVKGKTTEEELQATLKLVKDYKNAK